MVLSFDSSEGDGCFQGLTGSTINLDPISFFLRIWICIGFSGHFRYAHDRFDVSAVVNESEVSYRKAFQIISGLGLLTPFQLVLCR